MWQPSTGSGRATAAISDDELNSKLSVLRDAAVPQIKLRLPTLALKFAKGFKSLSWPTEFVVRPSGFRLAPWERILPLPVRISGSGTARTAAPTSGTDIAMTSSLPTIA
ncbi:hypothetical protein F7R91_20695 [Streptomyces luteolifulvus]|jgi:hypothetical protein|uniref:Uncharacterized protein n=1 Tax=Streptomyces luteolifulvus TaxID=2615112 RepID=A0A6H9UW86_9ACTN|nr:hypothetical protein [Streptomyces luteolifulvus]KAB1144667.1 hypothetical protein F7R91_20695 [Streptomyces luteolifulvus]